MSDKRITQEGAATRSRTCLRQESEPLQLQQGASTRISRFRWVILGLVFFATTINYVDRLVMGILAPDLQAQYGISNRDYGYIQAAFAMAYAFGQMASGAWLDRVGTRVGYVIALAAWSLSSALHALARSALSFGVMRAMLGVSESPNFPAAVKTLAEWFPKRERALAMGVVNAGSNVGAVLAPLAVPWLALHYGWQWAFIGTAAMGMCWLVFWIPIYRRPAEHPRVSPAELAYINMDPPEPVTKVPWVTLLSYRQAWAFVLAKFLTDPIWWFYMTWVPKFLHDRHGLNLSTIGLPLVAVYVMADLGSIGGGWLSSSLIHRGWSINRARKTAMFGCALCVIPIVFASDVSSVWAAVAIVGLATAAHQGFSSNLYTLVSDMFPRRTVGSVAGLGGTFGYLGATLFSGLTGHILNWSGQKYVILFVVAGSAYLVAFTVLHLLAPGLKPAVVDGGDETSPA
jgi:MFS transporter, ACS family, hexuronate transporter